MNNASIEFLVISVVIGVILLYRSIGKHKKLRQISDHPTTRIQTSPQGLNEFQGFAWPKTNPIISFEGIELIYYYVVLQKQVTKGTGKSRRTEWVTVGSYGFSHPFYIVDATGIAEVLLHESELSIEGSRTRNWTFISGAEKNFLLSHFLTMPVAGFPPSHFLFGIFSSSFRIIESQIPLGSPIYAKGDFQSSNSMGEKIILPGLTKFCSQVFDLKARTIRDVKFHLDTNKDGSVSIKEARDGYSSLAQFARKQAAQGLLPVPDQEMIIYGKLGSSPSHKLLIADCHEDFLQKRYRTSFYIELSIGIALLLFALILTFADDAIMFFEKLRSI